MILVLISWLRWNLTAFSTVKLVFFLCGYQIFWGKMATHKGWLPTLCTERIPCTEEPGGLQFIGWQRVGHNWATSTRLTFFWALHYFLGFPGGSDGKESACNEGDLGLIPGLGRSPAEGHGNHSSILAWRIPMDRGAWQATVHGIAELDTTERLSTTSLLSSIIRCRLIALLVFMKDCR